MYDVAGKRNTWVCAYANNQHELGTDIGSDDPRESSFYRALLLCDGVLLVLCLLCTSPSPRDRG